MRGSGPEGILCGCCGVVGVGLVYEGFLDVLDLSVGIALVYCASVLQFDLVSMRQDLPDIAVLLIG